MKIQHVEFVPGSSAFFFDDQLAIRNGAVADGFIYKGKPLTSGFTGIRMPGEAVSVVLVLEDGAIGMGDCAAVQYSGAGGRDPVFLAEYYARFLEDHARPVLLGMSASEFRGNAEIIDRLEINGKRLHTAARYGITQALLDVVSQARGVTKAEVVAGEWGLPLIPERVPLFGQSGDDRFIAAERMILKGVDVLPHALINNVEHKFGRRGEKLKDYLAWLVGRIEALKPREDYHPVLHIDVYGMPGMVFDFNIEHICNYMAELERETRGFPLYIEGPVDMGGKKEQIDALARIKEGLTASGNNVKIVADEWCNTLEDVKEFTDSACCHMAQIKTPDLGGIQNTVEGVLYCNKNGMESYQGGTCNETDVTARICTHIAIAARPTRMLVKPGMGFDEGFAIVNNEMNRTLRLLGLRQALG